MEDMIVDDVANEWKDEAHNYIMSRHIDMDAIISKARGRSRWRRTVPKPLKTPLVSSTIEHPQGSSDPKFPQRPPESVEHNSSSLPISPGHPTHGTIRVPGDMRSSAESSKKSVGKAEAPTGVQQQDG
jgi:hypothetical protein